MDERTRLAQTFDEVAELYDRVRPRYLPEIFDEVVSLLAGRRVVDVGAGTGIATHHVQPEGGDPFFDEIQDVYDEIGEGRVDQLPTPDDVEDLRAELEESAKWTRLEHRRWLHAIEYTADDYIAVLETYSGHGVMEDWQRERLYGAIRERAGSGTIRKHYLWTLDVGLR